MSGYDTQQMDCGIMADFGNPTLDTQFQQEVQIATSFFAPYAPQVYVLNECSDQGANAYSAPDGYILFGYYLSQRTIVQTGSTLPLAGILAHEWAHQLQFRNNWQNTSASTAAPTELEADAFSGSYMGFVKSWAGPQLNSYFQTLFNIGDFNFNNPGHHGTPNQRVAAGMLGMNLAYQLITTGLFVTWAEAHHIFAPQIQNILTTVQGAPRSPLTRAREVAGALASSLSWPANDVVKRLDYDLIIGIAAGTRSPLEFGHMPRAEAQRAYIIAA